MDRKKAIGALVYKCFKCNKRFEVHIYSKVFEMKQLFCGKCGEIMSVGYTYYMPLVRKRCP